MESADVNVKPRVRPVERTNNYPVKANSRTVINLLHITYGIVPIVAGLDKFTGLLTNWDKYLNPRIASMLPFSAHTFMMVAGFVEIVAGVIVLLKPQIGGFIVAAWLTLIALTLLLSGQYLDVAVRDLVMAIGAFTLAKLKLSDHKL